MDLLIIGAGPFGLAMDRFARHAGMHCQTLGVPMEFWKRGMPRDMVLRSDCGWHLDPLGEHTIEAWLEETYRRPSDVEPLSLANYLAYADWFRSRIDFRPDPVYVETLEAVDAAPARLRATLVDGRVITARDVVLALGFGAFSHLPERLMRMVPQSRLAHTSETVDFHDLAGRRCVIVGGRQSAFEWAALLAEAGAQAVHVVHRHETPSFEPADWTWVPPLLDRSVDDPGWYRGLPQEEKDTIGERMWQEGRLKLEPWLSPRLDNDVVRLWPRAEVEECRTSFGKLDLRVGGEWVSDIERVILATGYKVDLRRIRLLRDGGLLPLLDVVDGYPVLDEGFQTSVPGLRVTSFPAARDFGPFFGFTVAVPYAARMLGRALQED